MSNDDMTGAQHVPTSLLERYVGDPATTDPQDAWWWTVEAHLESCEVCRDGLAAAVHRRNPATTLLLEKVHDGLVEQVARSPHPPTRRRLPRLLSAWTRWFATPALLSRLVVTVLVAAAAVGLDLANSAAGGQLPSLVLLLAPVAPLMGVSAAWSRRLDPAYELVVASPRAGLEFVLRRTLAVLAVVIPTLAVAGWIVGVSPARWLLPCLALSVGALALGEVVGLHRAVVGLGLVWAVAVVGPSLAQQRAPAALDPASVPGWATATVVLAVVLVLRRRDYTGLMSAR